MSQLPPTVPPAGRGLGHDRAGCGSRARSRRSDGAGPASSERGGFIDHPLYLQTVRAERPDTASTKEALAAARLVGCKPGASILDAGCGNGRHALPLARARLSRRRLRPLRAPTRGGTAIGPGLRAGQRSCAAATRVSRSTPGG